MKSNQERCIELPVPGDDNSQAIDLVEKNENFNERKMIKLYKWIILIECTCQI